MFYGQEKALPYPVTDLFDDNLILANINAAKNMYDEHQKEMKDFSTKYGDFLSPSKIDTQNFYDLGMGKINKAIDYLYQNNIPLQSQEAQAFLSKQLNSVDIPKLQQLRESASKLENYDKLKSALAAEGKYNPLWEKAEGGNTSDYDTLQNGIWSKGAPVPYLNMAELSKDYYDNLKDSTLGYYTKNGVQYQKVGVDQPMIEKVANDRFNDLLQTPQGQIMFKQYLDSGLSKDDATKAFKNSIIAANLDRIHSNEDVDKGWAEAADLGIKREQLGIEKQKLNIAEREVKAKEDAARAKQYGADSYSYTNDVYHEGAYNLASQVSYRDSKGVIHEPRTANEYKDAQALKIRNIAASKDVQSHPLTITPRVIETFAVHIPIVGSYVSLGNQEKGKVSANWAALQTPGNRFYTDNQVTKRAYGYASVIKNGKVSKTDYYSDKTLIPIGYNPSNSEKNHLHFVGTDGKIQTYTKYDVVFNKLDKDGNVLDVKGNIMTSKSQRPKQITKTLWRKDDYTNASNNDLQYMENTVTTRDIDSNYNTIRKIKNK